MDEQTHTSTDKHRPSCLWDPLSPLSYRVVHFSHFVPRRRMSFGCPSIALKTAVGLLGCVVMCFKLMNTKNAVCFCHTCKKIMLLNIINTAPTFSQRLHLFLPTVAIVFCINASTVVFFFFKLLTQPFCVSN